MMREAPAAVSADVAALVKRGREQRLLFDTPAFEAAVPLLREALELEPTYAPAYAELSETYSYWGFRRESSCLGLRHETRLLEFQSLYNLAYDYADMAVRLAPDAGAPHRAMAAALRRGARADPPRRSQEAQLSAELAPEDFETRAECWRVRGYDPDDPVLRQTLESAPWLVAARVDLAAALCERGRYSDAFHELMAGLNASPDNVQIYYEIALVLDRQGLRPKALEVLRKALAVRGDDPLVKQGFALLGENI